MTGPIDETSARINSEEVEEDEEKDDEKPKIPSRQKMYQLAKPYIKSVFRDQTGELYVVWQQDGLRREDGRIEEGRKDVLNLDSAEFDAVLRRLYEADYVRIQKAAKEIDDLEKQRDEREKNGASKSELYSLKQEIIAAKQVFKDMMKHEMVISDGELKNAKAQLASLCEKKMRYLANRIFWDRQKNIVYYNVADEESRVIKITADESGNGVEIVKNSDMLIFKKLPESKCQILPSIDFDRNRRYLQEMTRHVNFREEHHRRVDEVYFASLMLPEINHPVYCPFGPEKSGKTLIQVLKKLLCDPDLAEGPTWTSRLAPSIPSWESDDRKEWDRATFIENNHISFFDNIDGLTSKQMDEACKWCHPGYSKSKEAKYKNKELISVTGLRPIGFNGINRAGTKGDFQSRTFAPELDQPDDENALEFEDVFDVVESQRPQIFGYLCHIISKFLFLYPQLKGGIKGDSPQLKGGIKGDRLPWVRFAEVISRCLGNSDNQLLDDWQLLMEDQTEATLGDSTLAKALIQFLREQEEITVLKRPDELYKAIQSKAIEINPNLAADPSFPRSSSAMSRQLNRLRGSFKKREIVILTGKDVRDVTGSRAILIENKSNRNAKAKVKEYTCLYQGCDHIATSYELLERHSLNVHQGFAFREEYEKLSTSGVGQEPKPETA